MAQPTSAMGKHPSFISTLEMQEQPRDENDSHDNTNQTPLDQQAQLGIQNIEAVTTVWSTKSLVIAYVLMWLIYFVEGLLSVTTTALNPYITSAFASHSLTPTVGIVSSIIGGVTNFTIAKILDVFGRPQGFLLCIIIAVIGLVMMAACKSVEAYAAAQVFYTVGNTGLQYTLGVFIADTSSLKNRGLMQAIATSPNMITCWLAGPLSSGFLSGPGWPWAFGMFSILVPAFSVPLWVLLFWHYLKARKMQVVPERKEQRSLWQSAVYYCREFDAVGLILLSAGVALFLLPFNLYALQAKGWTSPLIICLLVFGFILIIAFVLWERFWAPTTFIPYNLLTDRTLSGACLLSFTMFFSYFCWFSYFSSFLQVVNGLSVTNASYVMQINTVGSVLCAIGAGALIHYTGRFKPVCVFFGIPVSILGVGLLADFRRPGTGIGYVVMCQIFIALSSGTLVICDEIAALSAVSHQHVAVTLATIGLFGNIGGAIGLTVVAAIWQAVFPKALAMYLPVEELPNLLSIYADITTQLSYEIGSPTRVAIQHAYGDVQRAIVVAATAVWVLGAVAVAMWRNIKVSDIEQVRGHVA
ncbi:hypothetical protein D6D04_06418 [Aureobasidium pullulans]|nr:hypothetical protein D6D04_06418 [Aureobasidium pullulans]